MNPEEEEIARHKVKKIKEGGILISCNNREDVIKLHNASKEKLSTDYTIRKRDLKNSEIKIVGLSNEISENNLKCCILKQNPSIGTIETCKMLTCKKMKNKFMAIFEVDPMSFDGFMKLEQLNVKWHSCKVLQRSEVLQVWWF